jgi:ssRNA-specific RNase YbeY (16S rRNA maturation enzyme)
VLSFPYNEDLPEGVYFLGEIVVNVDEVKTKEEIIERVVHGAKDLLESVNGVNAPPR